MSTLIPNSRVYTDCEKNGFKFKAVRTKICQEDGEALKVDIGTRGVSKYIRNEVNSVPINIETLVASYTIPAGKNFDLSKVICSGDNIARFIIKVNGDIVSSKRTWWTNFNADFDLLELILVASDKVEVFVENRGSTTETFEATIIGGEYNE